MNRLAVRGIELNVEVGGAGPPLLLLLHGFTGDVTTWEPFLDAWPGYQTIRVDIIGHGASDSPPDATRYSLDEAVADLLALLDQLAIERTAVLGYSMGGRLALHLALAAPSRLTSLVLESASPGIESVAERQARAAADDALAADILRDGLEAFVDRWQAQALFASQSCLPPAVFERQRRQRLAASPLGLANSLRGMGAGRQDYLLPRLGELSFPVLLLAGALDERYTALTHAMARGLPAATVAIIEDAGHAAHLEQPTVFSGLVHHFLERHAARPSTSPGRTGSSGRTGFDTVRPELETTLTSVRPEPVEGRVSDTPEAAT